MRKDPPLRVMEVVLHENRVVQLIVEMPDPDRYTTDKFPHLPRKLFQMFPHLEHHECDNVRGKTFRKECQATEIPHLLEHLIIELQGQALPHSGLSGETQWNWKVDPRGRFHVYVQYENELLVLAAIRLAEKIINSLDNRELILLDMQKEIESLKEIAQLGQKLNSSLAPVSKPSSLNL